MTSRVLVLVIGWQVGCGCASNDSDYGDGNSDGYSFAAPDAATPNLLNGGDAQNGGQDAANNGPVLPDANQSLPDTNQSLPDAGQGSPGADQSLPGQASQDAGAPLNAASLVLPIERQDRYVLEFENLLFDCNEAYGGRITAFELEGTNVLTGTEVDGNNFGSTFWTSPQSEWGWPPPAEIDQVQYTSEVIENAVVLTGPPSPQLNVRVTKRFTADLVKRAIVLQYTVENTGSDPKSLAPWEVSRVHPGGLTFFPTGETTFGSGNFQPLSTEEAIGITWFKHDPELINADQKLLADGREGWIAHVTDDLVFIKTFPDGPANQCAPTEGEIEIYANQRYVEVEQQGAYQQVAPQAKISWTVTWYLRRLPQGIEANIGNQALIDFVRETIS